MLPFCTSGLNVPRCNPMGNNITDICAAYYVGPAHEANGMFQMSFLSLSVRVLILD